MEKSSNKGENISIVHRDGSITENLFFKPRQQKLPWAARKVLTYEYKDYGLYYGPTSMFQISKSGKFTTHFDYRPEPVDAVDNFARTHDQAYDAINAVGANSLDNDWGTMYADKAAIKGWQTIVGLGIGGKDPFNGQGISKDEYEAAKNGVLYFGSVVSGKSFDIVVWMRKNVTHETNNKEYKYEFEGYVNKFYETYMHVDSKGVARRNKDMWRKKADGTYVPIKPSELKDKKTK